MRILCNDINFSIAKLNRTHQKSMRFSLWLHEKPHDFIIIKKNVNHEQTRSCNNAQTSRWSADSLDVWRCVREATANEIKSGIINIIVGTRLGANSMFYILFCFFFSFTATPLRLLYIYLTFFICIFSMFTHGCNKMQWATAHVVNADRFPVC